MPQLYLSSLRLSHFRSHLTAQLEVGPETISFHGPNGAGKTNLLEAVSLLSPGRGLRRATAVEMARRPESIGWKITADLHSLGRVHRVESWSEPDSSRRLTLDGKPARQAQLGRIARILWLVPAMDRLWTEAAEGRRRFLDRLTMGLLPHHPEIALAYERAMRERNRLLREGSGDTRWLSALEGRMATAGTSLTENRRAAIARIHSALRDARTAFPVVELELVDGSPQSPEGLAAALRDGRGRDMAAGRTMSGPHRADLAATYTAKGTAARDCSTGEQKALLISLMLANARALAADFGAPPILLLDEVAAHLDADRRAALYQEIRSIGSQTWMTGTDASVFAGLGGDTQSVAVSEQGGVSRIRQIRTDPR